MKKVWETKGQYQTLDELVKYDYFPSMGSSAYKDNPSLRPYNGYEALKDWPVLRGLLAGKFDELGFRRLAYVGSGDFAIVLKTVENQVVRISVDTEENKRPKHPAILQPHVTYLVRDESNPESPVLRVEVLVQVKDKDARAVSGIDTEGVGSDHVKVLKDVLGKSGLEPQDLQIKNIALLSDGTPVVIDGGAVRQNPNTEILLDEGMLADWLSVDTNGQKTWKQYALHPEIEKAEITGTVTSKDIEQLWDLLGEDSQLYRAALEDGLYRAELGQLLVDATEIWDVALQAGQKTSFREILAETRRRYNKISGPEDDWPKVR